jgi:CDP-diglyceride synthetase
MFSIADIIGFVGVALLISTYAMLQFNRIDPKGFWYSFNNMIVAILVGISLYYTPNLASIVIEVFWFSLSVYGLFQYYKKD